MLEINPEKYQTQLAEKLDHLRAEFQHLPLPDIEVHESSPLNYRMRAEFRIWHEGGKAHFAMNKPGEKKPYIITDFPPGSTLINRLMPPLLDAINASTTLSRRLFSAEFLTTLSGDALITLIYHKPLDEAWQEAARQLQDSLGVPLIGRSRKQKLVLDRDHVMESLLVSGKEYRYQQVESGFTQPNAEVNQKMLGWALDRAEQCENDLLELYCGNGNFTCVLAQQFERVLATEISKISVRSAELNLESNGVENVTIVRMSSEEFTEALNGVRPFRRLRDIDLNSYRFSTIFVDPPRAGLDDDTVNLAQRFDNIIYISCNPETLRRNLDTLSASHEIRDFAVFDQFPYTHHLECGAFLTRRDTCRQ
ncbi:MAG: tRNA (uridine(54)-C5)-methyltransferase TrmA [Gammaproteobacteria bacterium]|nr:MAG: tRNA (uridine(54)-C5)-methyltransferase TrmA [Gammaproteobacteria bacterium]